MIDAFQKVPIRKVPSLFNRTFNRQVKRSSWRIGISSFALMLCVAIGCGSAIANPARAPHGQGGDQDERVKQTADSSSGQSQSESPVAPSFPNWEVPIIRGVAESGLAIVSLGFAAFTFLYGGLLTLKDDSQVPNLKRTLRFGLYGTAAAVILGAALSIVAFASIPLGSPVLGFVAIVLAVLVLLLLSGITGYLAWGVARGGH